MSIQNDDELETLRQELNAAKTHAAAAEVRVKAAEERVEAAEARVKAAEERVGAAEARAEAAEERSGNTDFLIFLELCYNLLSKDLLI